MSLSSSSRTPVNRYHLCAVYIFLALALSSAAWSQTQEILRNSDIVTMTNARLGTDTILLKIETSQVQFDTTTDALAVLKAVGVSDAVIAAMLKAGPRRAVGPATPGTAAAAPASVIPAAAAPANRNGKPLILLEPFTVPNSVKWPYDPQQLQSQTILILKTKDDITRRFDVSASAADAAGAVYTLKGEVISWKAGNRATRLLVGAGTGRESADIRYSLIDEAGKTVFEREDTIRAAFIGNAVAGSVGQLAEPFASKLADRLEDVRLPGLGAPLGK